MNLKRFVKCDAFVLIVSLVCFAFISCGDQKPVPVKLNVDNCDHCKMTIADTKFAAELITQKGRIYKFDDILCMIDYAKTLTDLKGAKYFVTDFATGTTFIDATNAYFIKGENIRSPMGGNIGAFAKKEDATAQASQTGATEIAWDAINK